MFSEIAEIKSIREQKKRLSEREAELTEPILTDLGMIGQLYGWFKEIVGERDCAPRSESAHQRKKFIFIVLFLYSPSTSAGGKAMVGLRDAIAKAIHLTDKTFISHSIKVSTFRYQHDKYFRRDVDFIFNEMKKRMNPG